MQSRQCDIFSNRHLFLPDHEPLFMARFLFYFSPNAAASGTAKPGGMYRKQIQKVHIVFSSIDKRTATASPLLRGVRRSRGVCIVNLIQKVHIIKGLLQYMLAPPALYIPRHYRGTPFERGRCRRDACTVICILNPAISTLIILMHRQSDCHRESPLERGTAKPGGMYRKQIQKVHI